VLYAPKAFFLDGGDELTVSQEYGRAVGVVCVDSENVHEMMWRFSGSAPKR
jgi:hypothetical protein